MLLGQKQLTSWEGTELRVCGQRTWLQEVENRKRNKGKGWHQSISEFATTSTGDSEYTGWTYCRGIQDAEKKQSLEIRSQRNSKMLFPKKRQKNLKPEKYFQNPHRK